MNRVLNWVFGSFFRTLGRVLVYLVIGFLVAYALKDIKMPKFRLSDLLFMNVSAETFTQDSRFTYYLYRNSDTPLTSGTGLVDSYGGSGYNRVQFLYNLYTFDSNYLYDITFTTYFSSSVGTGVLTANIWADNCSIYTGSGAQYNCTYTGGYDGNQVYMRSSITNMIGTDLSTLWLNFYSSNVAAVNLIQNSYKLEINRKENKNVTSENLQNVTDSIINSQNNNANNIINNQNSNTQDIIDNQNQNKQDIIDNQNANTQAQIDSQKVCHQVDKQNIVNDNNYLNVYGTFVSNVYYGITDYIDVYNGSVKLLLNMQNTSAYTCFYNVNKTLISCIRNDNLTNLNDLLQMPNNTYYFRSSIHKSQNKPQFEICKNGNQATADKLDDMNNYLTDDTPPDADISGLSTVQGLLPPGPVDSLLNIPVYFLSVLSSSMSGTCSPLQGDFIYDSTISIPCFSELIYENNSIPSALMLFINTIPSAFILIQYFKHLYKKVDRAVSMNASADDEWGVI